MQVVHCNLTPGMFIDWAFIAVIKITCCIVLFCLLFICCVTNHNNIEKDTVFQKAK